MDPLSTKHLKLACGLLLMGFLVHSISQEATLSVVQVPNIIDQTGKINSRDKDQGLCNMHRIRILFLWSAHPTQGSILSSLKSIWVIQGCREKWCVCGGEGGGYCCQPADGRRRPGPPAASEELISRLWYCLLLPVHGDTSGGSGMPRLKVVTLPACKCVICKWFCVFLSHSMIPNWAEHKQCWVCSRFKLSKLKKKKWEWCDSRQEVQCFRCWFV